MNKDNLPPLPKPDAHYVDAMDNGTHAYTEEQMQDYALASIAAYEARVRLLETDRDEWKDATLSANERFKIAERRLQKLGTLERMAATGTAENFLTCDDATKKLYFAMSVEESTRRKVAEERVRELEQDAARYRWLKDQQGLTLESARGSGWTREDGSRFIPTHRLCAGGTQFAPCEALDESIDAAMKKQPNE